MFKGEIRKDTLKRLCYCKRKASYRLLSCSGLIKFCACLYHASNILLRGMKKKYCEQKWLCSKNKLKVYISLKYNKLAYFENSQGWYTQVHDLVYDFWKRHEEVHASLPWHMHTPKVSKKACKKIVYKNFQFFQLLNYLHED